MSSVKESSEIVPRQTPCCGSLSRKNSFHLKCTTNAKRQSSRVAWSHRGENTSRGVPSLPNLPKQQRERVPIDPAMRTCAFKYWKSTFVPLSSRTNNGPTFKRGSSTIDSANGHAPNFCSPSTDPTCEGPWTPSLRYDDPHS
jgi:hypothetical protein